MTILYIKLIKFLNKYFKPKKLLGTSLFINILPFFLYWINDLQNIFFIKVVKFFGQLFRAKKLLQISFLILFW